MRKSRFVRRFLRLPDRVYVRLQFEDGPPKLLGPMDRFSAELMMIHRINSHPFYGQRRVVSARIHGDHDGR